MGSDSANESSLLIPTAEIHLPEGDIVPVLDHCRFGRHPMNTVVIDSNRASRWHAMLMRLPSLDYCLVDLATTNGTRVNGRRIRRPAILRDGNTISIGDYKIRFHYNPSALGSRIGHSLSTLPDTVPEDGPLKEQELDVFEPEGHGVLVLDRNWKICSMTKVVQGWLRKYFDETETERAPAGIIDWFGERSETARGIQPEPLVLTKRERRLSISLKPEVGGDNRILLLTEGKPVLSLEAMKRDFAREFQLTAKEAEVAFFAARGKTSAEIAIIQGNSERTIHKHLQRVYAKLGVENRRAVIVAIYDYYREQDGHSAAN